MDAKMSVDLLYSVNIRSVVNAADAFAMGDIANNGYSRMSDILRENRKR